MNHRTILATWAAFFSLALLVPAQGLGDPDPNERVIIGAVGALLEQVHYSGRPLDDTISRSAFDAFLDSYDPLKLYFTAADRNLFAKQRDQLDDYVKEADSSFAFMVHGTFVKRVDERVGWVKKLLEGDFDLENDEEFVIDRDEVRAAESDEVAKDLWRRRLEYELLSQLADGTDEKTAKERLQKRYVTFGQRVHQENREDVLSRFLNAVTGAFDPHTDYMSPKVFEDFSMGLNLNYEGIGALLGEEDGQIVIRRPMPGGVVEKEGKIKAGDRIIAIGQGDDDGEMVDVVGWRVNDVVKLIRGEEGTVVRLSIEPATGGAAKIHRLVRSRVELEDSGAKSRIIEAPEKGGQRIGVIDLPSFYRDTDSALGGGADYRSSAHDVRKILDEFRKEKVSAVVLDLRRNGGGYLPEAIELTGLFIDRGPVVQVKSSAGKAMVRSDRDAGVSWDGPMVVLQSRLSASASEILSGALRDYHRALIIGDSASHGKGTVQTPIDLTEVVRGKFKPGSLGVVKMTIQKFYRPDGESTQLRGVPSDIVLPSNTDTEEFSESSLPHALAFDAIQATKHANRTDVTSALVEKLATRSLARRGESEEFARLNRRFELFNAFRARKAVPLKREAFLAMRKELDDADPTTKEESAEPTEESPPEILIDAWLREALAITADYATELSNRQG